jgi:hypothetical protein
MFENEVLETEETSADVASSGGSNTSSDMGRSNPSEEADSTSRP